MSNYRQHKKHNLQKTGYHSDLVHDAMDNFISIRLKGSGHRSDTHHKGMREVIEPWGLADQVDSHMEEDGERY